MGQNKDIRKRIESHKLMIAGHEAKIRDEISKTRPDQGRIELWHKQIANAQAQIEKLGRRLHRHKR